LAAADTSENKGEKKVKIEGEYLFSGPRQEVWELVRDPDVLAMALPGTQSLEKVSDSEYQGTMNIRVGPVAGVFAGRIVISDPDRGRQGGARLCDGGRPCPAK
jgi:carbon monoxide dehydrogenase subunit G